MVKKWRFYELLKRHPVFLIKKTKNKKFFFQQILLIFALLLKDFYKIFLLKFFYESPEKIYFKTHKTAYEK